MLCVKVKKKLVKHEGDKELHNKFETNSEIDDYSDGPSPVNKTVLFRTTIFMKVNDQRCEVSYLSDSQKIFGSNAHPKLNNIFRF